MLGLTLWLARRPRGAVPPLPVQRRRIVALDLGAVRDKARGRHGWSEARAAALEGEYRDFLLLLAENPGKTISPWSDDLDLFWHEHILDTKRYAADCAHLFGRFIQHDPHIDHRPSHHQQTRLVTMALRQAQLEARQARLEAARAAHPASSEGGSAGDADGFDLALWGCSAGDDAGHGGHGSHGHGHDAGATCGGSQDGGHGGEHSCGGGHSCGGHGCGGHGCGGHGCGGH